jgi:hypothetical protein
MLGRPSCEMAMSTCLNKRQNVLGLAESWFGHTTDGMVQIVLDFPRPCRVQWLITVRWMCMESFRRYRLPMSR